MKKIKLYEIIGKGTPDRDGFLLVNSKLFCGKITKRKVWVLIMSKTNENWKTTKKERTSYAMFFLGQNMFYMFVYFYLSFFYTEVALIPAGAVATIFLVARVWDAVNDPMMGVIVDRSRWKSGKFIPWIRLSTILLPFSCILMFAVKSEMTSGTKIAFAAVTYILFGMIYTVNDAPAFALSTIMTDDVTERSTLMSSGRLCATCATLLAAIFVKPLANRIGWMGVAIVIAVWGVVMMTPVCRNARERFKNQAEGSLSLKEIVSYIKSNKYLLIFLAAFLLGSSLNFATSMGTYVAKYSLGNENLVSVISLICMAPMLVVPVALPRLMKRYDKKSILIVSLIINIVFSTALFIAGSENTALFLILSFGRCLGLGGFTTMSYMFVADCIEYGTYKTHKRAEGITFSLQTFCTKMSGAVAGAIPLFVFSVTGLNSSVPVAMQSKEALDAVWMTYTLIPVLGMIGVLLIIVFAYKLTDKDVQRMADINHGIAVDEKVRCELEQKYLN